MPELANTVTADEARLVRHIAATGAAPAEALHAPRIFLPSDGEIRLVEASGRSRCRECGERIEKGASAILFGFDPRAEYDSPSSWGRLAAAYLHADECQEPS
jgi:hypothetical protein